MNAVHEEVAVKTLFRAETQKKLADQSAATGERGALLVAVPRADGKKLAACRLDEVARFDALLAAKGRLCVSICKGQVVCLNGTGRQALSAAGEVVIAPRAQDGRSRSFLTRQ